MFPNYLDGARVLFYSQKDVFGKVNYSTGEKYSDIKYLAICRYGNNKEYYLFSCNEDFEVVGDFSFDSVEECKEVAGNSNKGKDIIWTEKTQSKAEFTFEEIKYFLLKSIEEYDCEAELSIYFEGKLYEYMIIIYKEYCSFHRCGTKEIRSGERKFKTLDELYIARQVDDIVLARDWDHINAFDCMDFELLGFWE